MTTIIKPMCAAMSDDSIYHNNRRPPLSTRHSSSSIFGGFVRAVSKGSRSKTRESRQSGSRGGGEDRWSILPTSPSFTTSSGYQKVSNNVAPAFIYPTEGVRGRKEKIVWGPPPISRGSRTVEGIDVVEDGQTQRYSALVPSASFASPLNMAKMSSQIYLPTPSEEDEEREEKAGFPLRRSFDSLFDVIDVLPSTQSRMSFVNRDANRQRSSSVNTAGLRRPQRDSTLMSSTARAKPVKDTLLDLQVSSPYQGCWTKNRSSTSEEIEDDMQREMRIRDKFQGKSPLWVVSRGWKKGIFLTYDEAEKQTRSFPGPLIRRSETVDDAIVFLRSPIQSPRGEEGEKSIFFDEDSRDLPRYGTMGSTVARSTSSPKVHAQHHSSLSPPLEKRMLRSPSTNPFLAEPERLKLFTSQSSYQQSEGSSSITSTYPTRSPLIRSSPSFQKLAITDGTDSSHTTGSFLLPPPVLSDPVTSPMPAVMSMVTCSDLDECVNFYQQVLGFRRWEGGQKRQGEVLLAHGEGQWPSVMARQASVSSPSSTASFATAAAVVYRSSIVVDIGDKDVPSLHDDVQRKLALIRSVRSNDKDSSTARLHSLFSEVKVELVTTTRNSSQEFVVFDVDGNMITFVGSPASDTM